MKPWIAAALLATGCYRSAPPAPPSEPARPLVQEPTPSGTARSRRPATPVRTAMADAIAKLGELADEMCACTDKACADAVTAEITRWSTEMAGAYRDEADKPSEDEVKEAMVVSERLSKCMMASMSLGTPPPPPSP